MWCLIFLSFPLWYEVNFLVNEVAVRWKVAFLFGGSDFKELSEKGLILHSPKGRKSINLQPKNTQFPVPALTSHLGIITSFPKDSFFSTIKRAGT